MSHALAVLVALSLARAEEGVEPARRHAFYLDQEGEIMRDMRWRDDDVVVSVPMKSGTTWTMNIVHQLRSGGDPELRDIYEACHWLEFWQTPTMTKEQLRHEWAREPTWYPRCFKTHFAPPRLPFAPHVRHVVVMRDPRDVIGSAFAFAHSHRAEFVRDVWGLPLEMFRPESVQQLFRMPFIDEGRPFIAFLRAWWPLRHEPNVLLLHFSDMVRGHRAALRSIADFLKMDLRAEQFERVCEYTSFAWMKQHADKFSFQHILELRGGPPLERHGMIRSGRVGSFESELPRELLETLGAHVNASLTAAQSAWLYAGGPLPPAEADAELKAEL